MVSALIALAAAPSMEVWGHYEEVRSLGMVNGRLRAGTMQGALEFADGVWQEVDAFDRRPILNLSPSLDREVGSPSDSHHVYCSIEFNQGYLAGTNAGLWARGERTTWTRQKLPSKIPTIRPHGLAEHKGQFVIGGIDGAWIGTPSTWRKIDDRPVRQIVSKEAEAWILFGDGSVDKLDLERDRRWSDILLDSTRRPWAGCIALAKTGLLSGGSGGWHQRGSRDQYPPELRGAIVTDILAGHKGEIYLGTQDRGLFRIQSSTVRHWNVADGLTDPWITSLVWHEGRLKAGTSRAGLFELNGEDLKPISSPTLRITKLGSRKGQLLVGGMNGAWLGTRKLHELETTGFMLLADKTAVLTPSGIFWLRGELN